MSTSGVAPDWGRRGGGVTVDPEFRQLYEREFPAVYRAALLLSGDRRLAEDAAQEAFARALARWRRLRSHPSPGGWVTTTALNVARRQLRHRPEGPMPVAVLPGIEDRIALHDAIRALPSRQQEAVALHYLLDLPVTETAAAMGIDVGTVKTHLSRARAALQRALREDEPNPESKELPR
jgi:RNA polymerase sigma-70 factor, ECF subfamily